MHVAAARQLRILLAQLTGDLCQGFGRSDTQADRNARILFHALHDLQSEVPQRGGFDARKIHETFVDGIDLGSGGVRFKGIHNPRTDVPIEFQIGRKDSDVVALEERFLLIVGIAHLQPERFCFITPGNDAPVVIRQYDDGPPVQIGGEQSFAGIM